MTCWVDPSGEGNRMHKRKGGSLGFWISVQYARGQSLFNRVYSSVTTLSGPRFNRSTLFGLSEPFFERAYTAEVLPFRVPRQSSLLKSWFSRMRPVLPLRFAAGLVLPAVLFPPRWAMAFSCPLLVLLSPPLRSGALRVLRFVSYPIPFRPAQYLSGVIAGLEPRSRLLLAPSLRRCRLSVVLPVSDCSVG